MKLLADVHISPLTVTFLKSLGHDVLRVSEVMSSSSTDHAIVACARQQGRSVLTQDLDFSAIVALSAATAPSVLTLRLSSSRIEHVNARLTAVLAAVEATLLDGALVTVEDSTVRVRLLPLP